MGTKVDSICLLKVQLSGLPTKFWRGDRSRQRFPIFERGKLNENFNQAQFVKSIKCLVIVYSFKNLSDCPYLVDKEERSPQKGVKTASQSECQR